MAYSYVAYTGNGSTTQFAITFPYVSQAHIKVYVNFVDTAYTYANSTTVQVATAPTNGHRVEVRRVTPINSVLVDYTDGATLVAADLDTTALQNLYLEQELDDNQKRAIYVDDATGLMTANGQRITNVANPTGAQDAATKSYVDTVTLAGNVPDGDRGDITVSGIGTNWTIDAGAVTSAKILDGTIVNADINASAAIAGTKITPNFGAQTITTAGDLRLADSDSSHYVGFQSPATVATSLTWTLPNADAAISGYALVSNASGTLSWAAAGGGATGASTDKVFFENDQTVTTSYTLTASKNAITAGPVTINSSVTVTIPSGASWVVV